MTNSEHHPYFNAQLLNADSIFEYLKRFSEAATGGRKYVECIVKITKKYLWNRKMEVLHKYFTFVYSTGVEYLYI